MTDKQLKELCGRLAEELEELKFKVRMYRHEHGTIDKAAQILREYEADLNH